MPPADEVDIAWTQPFQHSPCGLKGLLLRCTFLCSITSVRQGAHPENTKESKVARVSQHYTSSAECWEAEHVAVFYMTVPVCSAGRHSGAVAVFLPFSVRDRGSDPDYSGVWEETGAPGKIHTVTGRTDKLHTDSAPSQDRTRVSGNNSIAAPLRHP